MVAQQHAQPMSVEEWRRLLRTSEHKYHYLDGTLVLMAGGTIDHATIASHTLRALEDALGERPCRALNSDVAARVSPSKYVFPDVTVTCAEQDSGTATEVSTPLVVVEVLSEGTRQDDYGIKAPLYRACPSIQEYIFIETAFVGVEVYRRAGDLWVSTLYGPGAELPIACLDVVLAVDALYRRTTVPSVHDAS